MGDEYYELRIGGANHQANFAENVLSFKVENGTLRDPYDVADDLLGWATAPAGLVEKYLPCLSTDFAVNLISARRIDPAEAAYASRVIGATGTGGSVGASNGLCACLRVIPVALATRKKQGHIYIPSVPREAVDGDEIIGAYRDALQDLCDLLGSNFTIGPDTLPTDLVIHNRNPQAWTLAHVVAIALKPISLMGRRTVPLI